MSLGKLKERIVSTLNRTVDCSAVAVPAVVSWEEDSATIFDGDLNVAEEYHDILFGGSSERLTDDFVVRAFLQVGET